MSQYKEKKDLDFLFNLLVNFVCEDNSNKINSKLSIISKNENEITGWETWFQVEFYLYLMEQKQLVKDVVREYPYELDQRTNYAKSTNKGFCRVDIEICKKKATSEEKWLPLEIKQNRSARTCFKNLLDDCDKYDAIKSTEKLRGNFRYPFFLGIFKDIEKEKLDSLIKEFGINPKFSKIEKIPNTNYTFILF